MSVFPLINDFFVPKLSIKNGIDLFRIPLSGLFHTNNDVKSKLFDAEAELLSHIEILNQSALVTISDLKGNIIQANDKFCTTSKYAIDEVIGKPHNIIRHPDTPAAVFKEMWRTIANGSVWQGELKNRAKDGSTYWVIATVAPVMGVNGKPKKYISVRYDITAQKQAEEKLLEAKNKIDDELYENIKYAKCIHGAFLNDTESIEEIHEDSFLIYKAQKIISGDFYKMEKRDNKLIYIIGDSTGHGVSASYISILAINIINRIIQVCSCDPATILKKLNHELNKATHPDGRRHLTESADVIACCLDLENMTLKYASARMKAFIIRNGEVITLEKDKHSIGESAQKAFRIVTHTLDVRKGDCIYIFSDGVTDQFGGPLNKRIGLKRVIELLKSSQKFSMPDQRKIIEDALLTWQGHEEQTDDMTLFGIKI